MYFDFGSIGVVILPIAFVVVTGFLARTVFIIMGLLKGPILGRFEKYGDDEDHFPLLVHLLVWAGAFIIISEVWAALLWGIAYAFFVLGIALIATAYFVFQYPQWTGTDPDLIFIYPRWLHDLKGRTTRLERRRIAYMWLRLPWRLRLIYNSNDRAFLEWADMVILSTLM